jgi:predicted ABC-type ATPase
LISNKAVTPIEKRSKSPVLVVLAGPNGAGKSTFHENFIAHHGLPFVNADIIAKDMASKGKQVSDVGAAKLAERIRLGYLKKRKDFCMETVFSDSKGHKRDFLRLAQNVGYVVVLVFIGLDSPEMSHARVKSRVEAGGHAVPPGKLDERFPRTFENLRLAIPHLDYVYLYDNSSYDYPYRPVVLCRFGKFRLLCKMIPSWVMKALPELLTYDGVEHLDVEETLNHLLGFRGTNPNE